MVATARRTTRAARSRAARTDNRANNVTRSNEPARKWVQVKRPPAPGVGFEIELWVALDELTDEEKRELFPLDYSAMEVEDSGETDAGTSEPMNEDVQQQASGDPPTELPTDARVEADLLGDEPTLGTSVDATATMTLQQGIVTSVEAPNANETTPQEGDDRQSASENEPRPSGSALSPDSSDSTSIVVTQLSKCDSEAQPAEAANGVSPGESSEEGVHRETDGRQNSGGSAEVAQHPEPFAEPTKGTDGPTAMEVIESPEIAPASDEDHPLGLPEPDSTSEEATAGDRPPQPPQSSESDINNRLLEPHEENAAEEPEAKRPRLDELPDAGLDPP